MQHHFDISIASKYGVNVAIFLNNMSFWIHRNIANNKHFHDENYWTYNSVEAYRLLFPYWTTSQVRTTINNCIKYGLIVEGNYNEKQYDRTKWYCLSIEGQKLCGITICQNSQMDLSKSTNGFAKNHEPIPDRKPDNKTDNKSSCTQPLKKPKPKSRKDHNNEQKHHWHANAKVCDPITQDETICEGCKRPSHSGACSENGRLPKELQKLFSGMALSRLTGKRTETNH